MDSPIQDLTALAAFLTERNWPVSQLGDNTLRSSFRGATRTHPLIVQLDPPWARLMVVPLARIPQDSRTAEVLYDRLLRLNGEMLLARFSLDEDGDVLLSVELPLQDLDPSELRDALDVLAYYADRYQASIKQILASATA